MADFVCEFQCNDGRSISQLMSDMIYKLRHTLPFSQFYGNIELRNYADGFIISDNKYYYKHGHEFNNDWFKPNVPYIIEGSAKYEELNTQPRYVYDREIDHNIPIFFRKTPELVEMMKEDYYKFFCYGNIVCRMNPTVEFSQACRYVITPTISPLTSDDIVAVLMDLQTKKYLDCTEFYKNPNLFMDLYNMYCELWKFTGSRFATRSISFSHFQDENFI
jgi:hypothetical protein